MWVPPVTSAITVPLEWEMHAGQWVCSAFSLVKSLTAEQLVAQGRPVRMHATLPRQVAPIIHRAEVAFRLQMIKLGHVAFLQNIWTRLATKWSHPPTCQRPWMLL